MSSIYCSTPKCNRTAHGRMSRTRRPLCEQCFAAHTTEPTEIVRMPLTQYREILLTVENAHEWLASALDEEPDDYENSKLRAVVEQLADLLERAKQVSA